VSTETTPMLEAQQVVACANQLGEGPLWDPAEEVLYWVDIYQQRIHRLDPASGEQQVFEQEARVTALGRCERGGLVVTTDKAFAFWDAQRGELVSVAAPEALLPQVRFNDAAVDRHGRFWAGTMNEENGRRADGCLYRLEGAGTVRTMSTGYTITNGLGWSPDNTRMYVTDSARGVIWLFDFDLATGELSNQRPFVEIAEGEGVPDGLTVDSEGFVWSALWDGWRVVRYSPAGRATLTIRLPVQRVTCCAFGGVDLADLYITTAWLGLSDEERRMQPQAGDLFVARVGIRGMAEPRFTGKLSAT
jgi:sugar lactone lactonase YvrE